VLLCALVLLLLAWCQFDVQAAGLRSLEPKDIGMMKRFEACAIPKRAKGLRNRAPISMMMLEG
jgi:hypothetical protein